MIRSWIRSVAVLLILAGACFAAEGDAAHLVGELLEVSGMQRGLCCMLGTQDGTLPLVLVRRSGLLVHVIEPGAARVAAARKRVGAGGLWLRRVVVEQGGFRTLPYADNTVDLLVAVRLTDKTLADYSQAEILRVLRPGGRAILGSPDPEPGELTPEKL